MASQQQQLVKISWQGEMRLIPCNDFQDLVKECSTRFNVPVAALSLSYKDSEGDWIIVASDAELAFAFKHFEQQNARPKFVLERKKKQAAPAAPAPTEAPKLPAAIFPSLGAPMVMRERLRMAALANQQAEKKKEKEAKAKEDKAKEANPASPAIETKTPATEEKPKAKAQPQTKEEKKKCAKKLKKEQQLKEEQGTRLIRLRWREDHPSTREDGKKTAQGCYLGVHWKNRVVNLDCGKGLKSFWMIRRLDNGDWVLTSVVCPKRFLRMRNTGQVEFNTGEPGPYARWFVVDAETGEKIESVESLVENTTCPRKIKLSSKANAGKFVGKKFVEKKKKNEKKKDQINTETVSVNQGQTIATSDLEGLAFTVERVDAISAKQVVKLCRHGLNIVDPKTEDETRAKKVAEKKAKLAQPEQKQQPNKCKTEKPKVKEEVVKASTVAGEKVKRCKK